MMICVFSNRAFVIRFLVVLVLISVFGRVAIALCVIRSKVDAFSNPDAATCSRTGCRQVRGANACKGGNCCMCQCGRNTPNYLIHRNACVPNDELGDCDFSFPSSEIALVDFSKASNVQFEGDPEGCVNGLRVAQWSYRLHTMQEIIEQPNNFMIHARWSNRWSLQWNTGLDAKYSGLILKFDLACPGRTSGYTMSQCLLVKSKGNYTLSEAPPSPPQHVVPSDVAVDVHGTGRKVEPTVRIEINSTRHGNINNVQPGETAAETDKKRKTEEKNSSVVVVSVCLSLVAGVALVCVVVLRRSGSTRSTGLGSTGARDAAYEEPADPATRYAGLQRSSNHSFQNEFYDADCVLSIEGPAATNNNKCRLGPLPPLPKEEGIYEEPMITRSAGYHGLATEAKKSSEQTKDVPAIEEEPPPVYNTLEPPSDGEDDYDDAAEPATEESPPPVYNNLMPPSDGEDDYDDTTEPAIEEPPPVYNTLEAPSDDEDDFDDTAEPAIEESPPPVYNNLMPPSDGEDDYDDTTEPAIEEPPPVYNTLEASSDDEDDFDDTAESAIEESPPPVYNNLMPPSDDEDDYDDTTEPATEEEPPPVYNSLMPPSDDKGDYDNTAESRYRTV